MKRQVAGWLLLGLGALGLLIPFIPGSLLIAVGALLLAPHVRPFRRMSAWFHKRFPHLRRPMRRFRPFKKANRYFTVAVEPEQEEKDLAKQSVAKQSEGDVQSQPQLRD
ncbi:MAG: hypothetical protein NZ740_05745 [Kiritimatiellae bacterium]|nr:hypothetical protein [Kiritimatiellia bacterium]MDW8458596.1 hypothetical protein [Verrucomicrobiota bacterium]